MVGEPSLKIVFPGCCALNTHQVPRDLRVGRALALTKCGHTA